MFVFRISGLLVDNSGLLPTSSDTTIDIDVEAKTYTEAERKVHQKLTQLINNEEKEDAR